jgi:hypothetical protein
VSLHMVDRSRGRARLLVVKTGGPSETFHHALSTKREVLTKLRDAPPHRR